MYCSKENQKFHLSSWDYNKMLIFAELRKIAAAAGDQVKPAEHNCIIVNRSIKDQYTENAARLEHLEQVEKEHPGTNDKRTIAIAALKEKQAQLAAAGEKSATVPADTYIYFKHAGTLIYYQMDDNPFFPFYYHKSTIASDNTTARDTYLSELNKEWLIDPLLTFAATPEQIHAAALEVYNLLISAPCSQVAREKIRVKNVYDNRYHYEYKPARRVAVDW